MKRFCVIFLVVFMLQGCISMGSIRNTTNRLQGDVHYFKQELNRYSVLFDDGQIGKVNQHLVAAEDLLSKVESASLIGDKLAEKKYFSALVDVMDILESIEK